MYITHSIFSRNKHNIFFLHIKMPRKGMRSICFNPKTPSFSQYSHNPSSLPGAANQAPLLRNFSESMVDQTLESASILITKWNADTSAYAKVTSLFYENRIEAEKFMKIVGELQKIMHILVKEDSTSYKLGQAQNLMQIAMKRLQKEFYHILSTNRAELDPESVSTRSSTRASSSISDYEEDDSGCGASLFSGDDVHITAGNTISEMEEAIPSIPMADLKSIAECMISFGYAKECTHIYQIIRKSIIDEAIYRLGVEKLSTTQMKNKMSWEILEIKIKNWLESVKVVMTTLFHGERILCDTVFSSSENIRESCFSEISKEGALLMFGFPEQALKTINYKFKKSATVQVGPSPEKMSRVLDMYTAIAENWQNIETIFSFNSTSIIRSQALNSLIKLSDSVRLMITGFERSIEKDSSKFIVPGGGVHALIYDSMDFLTLLADYFNVLADILVDWSPPTETLLFPDFYFNSFNSDESSPSSTVSAAVAWLILVLLCKIDSKAKLYKDVSLSYLFLANNLSHVAAGVRSSNLRYLLGDEWITKHEMKIKQFAASYEKFAWGPVYNSLPENPTAEIPAREVKEWFKRFNSRFEEAYRKQSGCIISEPRFRDEMKVLIAKKIVPIYRELYERSKVTGGSDVEVKRFVRFAPEDIGNYLSDLFFGAPATSTATTSYSSHNKPH